MWLPINRASPPAIRRLTILPPFITQVFHIWEANQVLYRAVGRASSSLIELNSVLLKFSLDRTIQEAVLGQMKEISSAIDFADEVPFHAVRVSVPDMYGFCPTGGDAIAPRTLHDDRSHSATAIS